MPVSTVTVVLRAGEYGETTTFARSPSSGPSTAPPGPSRFATGGIASNSPQLILGRLSLLLECSVMGSGCQQVIHDDDPEVTVSPARSCSTTGSETVSVSATEGQ